MLGMALCLNVTIFYGVSVSRACTLIQCIFGFAAQMQVKFDLKLLLQLGVNSHSTRLWAGLWFSSTCFSYLILRWPSCEARSNCVYH